MSKLKVNQGPKSTFLVSFATTFFEGILRNWPKFCSPVAVAANQLQFQTQKVLHGRTWWQQFRQLILTSSLSPEDLDACFSNSPSHFLYAWETRRQMYMIYMLIPLLVKHCNKPYLVTAIFEFPWTEIFDLSIQMQFSCKAGYAKRKVSFLLKNAHH